MYRIFLFSSSVRALYGCAFYFYLGRFMACLQAIYINTWYMKIKLCNKICRWTHWTNNLEHFGAKFRILLFRCNTSASLMLLLWWWCCRCYCCHSSWFAIAALFCSVRPGTIIWYINTDFHISFVLSKQHNYSFTEMCAFTTEDTRYEKLL